MDLDPQMNDVQLEPREDIKVVPFRDVEHSTYVRMLLSAKDVNILSRTLVKNNDIFSWTPSDMPRVSPKIIRHGLLMYEEARLVS